MEIRDVTFEVDRLRLTGQLYLPGDKTLYPVVCVCHGIPSAMPKDPEDGGYPALAETICGEGFAVLIFSFRGTGKSEGNFDIMGWTEDLNTAIDFLWQQPEVDRSRIALLGFSAGAGVAICVGSQDKNIAAVAACASPAEFTSLINDAKASLAYFGELGIIRDKDFPESEGDWADNFKIVNPLYYVSGISPRPLLLVHGEKDEVVKPDNARQLFAKAQEPKRLIMLENGGHRLRRDPRAVKAVIEWLKEVLADKD